MTHNVIVVYNNDIMLMNIMIAACRPEEATTEFTCGVHEHVQVAITGLQNDFERCVCTIRSSLESASIERIKELLTELPPGEVKGQVGCLLTQRNNYHLIMASTSVCQLFMNLSNIHAWDFLHPQLLDYLIQKVGKDSAKSSIEEYKSKLLRFRRTTKMIDLSGWIGDIPENLELFQKLVIKLGDNWKDKTYQEFEEMRISLLRQQVFVRSSLSLCGVLPGSILVILVTPKGQLDVSAMELALHNQSIISALMRIDISSIYAEGLCLYLSRDNVRTSDDASVGDDARMNVLRQRLQLLGHMERDEHVMRVREIHDSLKS